MTTFDAVPDEDGIYAGLSDELYHADHGSLSSSGARTILEPGGPAKFAYDRATPRLPSDAFDLGHAVHTKILGIGGEFVDVGFDAWTTKASKEAREAAREAGQVPLKTSEYRRVTAMCEALLAHPLAEILFSDGDPELSIYHHDEQTGTRLRARPDWMPRVAGGRPMIVDLKTTLSADPGKFVRKSVPDYGYHQQDPWYRDAVTAAGLGDDPQFLFVLVEKSPPHLASVIELPAEAVAIGRSLNRPAVDLYADCVARDRWPGYPEIIHRIDLPPWAYTAAEHTIRQHERQPA
ncbi:DNA helicase [Gordonia phage Marteena]|nr:DNA helicase [Gordonia phage EMsquaredA]QDP45139.1 DNA helicase [Gordonia phage Marteena]